MTLKGVTSRYLNPWLHFNLRASLAIESVSWFWLGQKIFLLVPGSVLFFGFGMRIRLISCWYVNCESMTVQHLILCPWARAHEAAREHSQDSWSELAKGIFHTQNIMSSIQTEAIWPGTTNCCLGMGWTWWIIALCSTCRFWVLFLSHSPSYCWCCYNYYCHCCYCYYYCKFKN